MKSHQDERLDLNLEVLDDILEDDVHVGDLPDTLECALPETHSRKFHRLRKGSRREKEGSEDEDNVGADFQVPQPSGHSCEDDRTAPPAQEEDVVDTNVEECEEQDISEPESAFENHLDVQSGKKKKRRDRSPGVSERETRETKKVTDLLSILSQAQRRSGQNHNYVPGVMV